jgi:hypothetical protein
LRLFVFSICPKAFEDEIKTSLFNVFDEKNYSDFISGAEYKHFLRATFKTLEKTEKDSYISNIFSFFGAEGKESFYKTHGLRLLSCIDDELTEDEKKKSELTFGQKPDPAYTPLAAVSSPSFATQ